MHRRADAEVVGQLWLSSLKVAVQEEMAQQTLQTEIDDSNPEERKET